MTRPTLALAGAALAVAATLAGCSSSGSSSTTTTGGSGISFGLPQDPAAAIKAAGLEPLGGEGNVLHHHAHLDVIINGQKVTVPGNIGIIPRQAIAELHTHDNTGVIHIESFSDRPFTLGQLFTEWGVKLDPSCVATYCTDATNELAVFVDGKRVSGDPTQVPIGDHQEIVVWYGPKGKATDVPGTYDFGKL